jgi:hypothetical protein
VVSGLSGVLDAPVYNRSLAEVASVALLAMILVGATLRWRQLRPTFWAAVAALATLFAATRISPGGHLQVPDSPRYLYPETVLLLWIVVELGAAWRDLGTARSRSLVAGFATAVLLLGTWSNIAKFDDAGSRLRTTSSVARGQYSAYDLAGDHAKSDYRPNPFLPSAGEYLEAATAYGSIGLDPAELARAPQPERAAADRTLIGALGLSLTPAPRAHKGCVVLPATGMDLPAGGASIGGRDLGDVTFTLARFAEPPATRLTPQPGISRSAVLRIPTDGADAPWRLQQADSRRTVTVCDLPSGT